MVKLGRIPGKPDYADNYVDLANYAAFSAHFADKAAGENVVKPSFLRTDEHVRIKTPVLRSQPLNEAVFAAALGTVEEDIVDRKVVE